MNQHEMTRRIVNAWMARATVAAICAGITLAAHANYDWQGTTGEWNGSVANWWDGSALVPWADGSYAYLPVAGAGIVTDIVVDAGGVTASTYEQQAGSSYTLSGGPVATTTLSVGGNDNGTSPASLTINNAVSANGFYFKGAVTVANGGTLTVGTYQPSTTSAAGVDTAKVTVLAGGTLEVTNFNATSIASNYSTLYVDGGTVKHALTSYSSHKAFSKSHIKVGPGGMRVSSKGATGQMSFLPYPVESGGDTDGGLWVDDHSNYYLLYGSNSYKGGLHLMPSGGQVGVQADSNLGAATSTPTNSIIYEGDGTTQTGPVLVSHSQSSVTLGANRDILIGDNVKARFSTYSASSRLVLRGAIDCVDRTNGVLQIGGYSTGPVVIETSGGRTNHLGRLIVTQPLIIGNGTTLVENTKGISRETGGHAEDWGVHDGAVMNIRDSGHLMVTGGVLKATGSRNLCISANMTVSDGGIVDLTGHEVLHGYNGPAITTVRSGGKLVVSTVRMAGDNGTYYKDPTKSVVNVETGGVLRVTSKMHITDSVKRATLSFNGGMLEWGASSTFFSGTGTYQDTSRVGLLVYVKEGGMVVSNASTFYIDQPIQSGAATDGGITKWGTGEMALSHPTNTFNGPIRVMQGTFATFGARINPINTNCTVCVNANTSFRANTSYHTFARIEGSGSFTQNTDHNFTVWQAIAPGMGTNSLGTLTVSGGPVNILDGVALEIDLDAEGHSDCFKCSGELDLSKMTLQVNDVTKLGKNKKYAIASNLTGVTGEFKSTNLPPGWGTRYYAASNELKIVPINGTTLIVR